MSSSRALLREQCCLPRRAAAQLCINRAAAHRCTPLSAAAAAAAAQPEDVLERAVVGDEFWFPDGAPARACAP